MEFSDYTFFVIRDINLQKPSNTLLHISYNSPQMAYCLCKLCHLALFTASHGINPSYSFNFCSPGQLSSKN